MSYLHDGTTHNNYDPAFMADLGMSDEAISATLVQREFERHEGQLLRRQRAYVAESDPLFLEWQYDQAPEKEQRWRDKVAEIKVRHPVSP